MYIWLVWPWEIACSLVLFRLICLLIVAHSTTAAVSASARCCRRFRRNAIACAFPRASTPDERVRLCKWCAPVAQWRVVRKTLPTIPFTTHAFTVSLASQVNWLVSMAPMALLNWTIWTLRFWIWRRWLCGRIQWIDNWQNGEPTTRSQ